MATSKHRKPPRTRTTKRRGTTSTRLVKPRRKRTAARSQRVANFSLFNINFGGTGSGRGRRKRRFQGFLKGLFKTGREVGKGVGRHMPQAGCLNSPGSIQKAAARTGGRRQPSRVTGAGAGAAATLSARRGSRSPRSRFAASMPGAGGQAGTDPLDTDEAIENWTERTGEAPGGACPCGGIARHTADCEVWQ